VVTPAKTPPINLPQASQGHDKSINKVHSKQLVRKDNVETAVRNSGDVDEREETQYK